MNFAKTLLTLVIFWQFCDANEITKNLKKQVKELKTKHDSIKLFMDGMDAAMKYVYPDMPEMDPIRSMTNVNLRHTIPTKKYKKFKKQVKNIEKEWYGDFDGNSNYSLPVMTNKINHYNEIMLNQSATSSNVSGRTIDFLEDFSATFSNVNGRATSGQIEALEKRIEDILSDMTSFENMIAAANELLMGSNTPTPPGDLLLVAVGAHPWTEAHDMNKTLNRTCALEVLPEYPLASGNSLTRLSFPAGGLVSGRPFFCGGKSGETIHTDGKAALRTECYILGGGVDNITWDLVANLTTARWQHAGVSFGDSLWVTGGYMQNGTVVTNTTEIIHANGTVEDGPDLEDARAAHCMVLLPPGTKVMILGADKAFGSRKTVTIFDRITGIFTVGAKMNYNRENAACTIFKSPKHGNRPVVFIGGGKQQITAEILDYSQSGATWEEVPSMSSIYPDIKAMSGSRAVPTPSMDGVIFIFGPDFWELTFKNSSSQWKMIEMTPTPQLTITRKSWPIVEYIDENLIDVTGLCA